MRIISLFLIALMSVYSCSNIADEDFRICDCSKQTYVRTWSYSPKNVLTSIGEWSKYGTPSKTPSDCTTDGFKEFSMSPKFKLGEGFGQFEYKILTTCK